MVPYSEKINGYTKEEAQALIDYVSEGKKAGKSLSFLFEGFGKEHGRAKGSERNYYYALLKDKDERVVKLLDGRELSVEKIHSFTPEETDEVLKSILREKAKGMSVRKAILTLTAGDEKRTLRMQNKYRNLLKKQPEYVERTARELGLEQAFSSDKKGENGFLRRRLEAEIDALITRITEPLERENAHLKEEIKRLKEGREGLV